MNSMYEQNLPSYLAHGLEAINAFVDDTPLQTDIQRQFYSIYMAARYEALLERGGE